MSAQFPHCPKADVDPRIVMSQKCQEPTRAVQQKTYHSMSWSARRRKDSEIVRPRVLAAFRLMTSANLVGCWTGRSEGLAPVCTENWIRLDARQRLGNPAT